MKKNFSLILTIIMVVLSSCKHNKEIVGPELGKFSIVSSLSSDKNSVDFSKGETVVFSAQFLSKVNWILQIQGQTSNIKRTFSGVGSRVDATNATWIGDADHPGFKIEPVTVTLKFPDYPLDSNVININITGIMNISSNGILVHDFETGISGLSTYGEPGEIIENKIDSDPVLGGHYYDITGTDLNGNYFIGVAAIPATAKYYPTIHYPVPHVALDDVYFNCFIYGSGDATTQVSFDFQEDDLGDSNPGVYDPAHDDTWSSPGIIVDWKGWKLVSFQMSKTTRSTQLAFGGSGNGIQEIDRILNVQLVLLAINNKSTPVKGIIDYPVFTLGAPFVY